MKEYNKALFEKFNPIPLGSRVILIKDVIVNDKMNTGYTSIAHCLKKGAMATVKEVDYRKNGFVYDIILDKETWLDRQGVEHDILDKGHVCLSEEFLAIIWHEPLTAKEVNIKYNIILRKCPCCGGEYLYN